MPGLAIYPQLPAHPERLSWGDRLIGGLTRLLTTLTTTVNSLSRTGLAASKPTTPELDDIFYTETDGLRKTYIAVSGAWVMLNGTGVVLGARVHHSAATTVADVTPLALTFDSERFDTDGMHSTATSASRLTCITAGLYDIGGQVRWVAGTASTGQRQLTVRLNGTTTIAEVQAQNPAANGVQQIVSTRYVLAAADYVELMAQSLGNGTQTVSAAGNTSPEFWAVRLGPTT